MNKNQPWRRRLSPSRDPAVIMQDALSRFTRSPAPERHSSGFNGSTKIVMWLLGVFATIITALVSMMLQAVYVMNGEVHELRGQVVDLQNQVLALTRSERRGPNVN